MSDSQWPQKMGTEVTSFFEGAAPSIRLGMAAVTTEQEVDRDFSLTPTEEVEKRHRDHSRGRDNRLNRNSLCRDNLCLKKKLPVMYILPELKEFYPSVIVNQLMGLGIVLLAIELAKRSLPLAGRLQHFKKQLDKDHTGSMPYRATEYPSISSLIRHAHQEL